MFLSKKPHKKTKEESNWAIHFALIIMSFSYYIFTFTKEISFLHFPFLLLFSFLPFYLLYKFKVDQLRPKNGYRTFFTFSFFIIIINTILYGLFNSTMGEIVASFGIYSQIIVAYNLSKENFRLFFKNFKIVAVLCLIFLPFIIMTASFDASSIANRETVNETFFTFAGSFWIVVPFVLYSIITKTKIKLALLLWVAAVALNLLFLKRFIIIDSLLLIIAIIFIQLNEKQKLFNRFNLFVLMTIPLISFFISSQESLSTGLDTTIDRITDQSIDKTDDFDRFKESNDYLFEQANLFDIIIGRGFSGKHIGYSSESLSLHTGWANFILKGGFFLFILVVIPFLKAILLLASFKKLPNYMKFSVIYIVIHIVRLLYHNLHNYRPELLLLFFTMFTVMDYKHKKRI